ncbi:MAG: hypothetical protein GF317_16625 [Candidatus Lokiarchaeota archaeon]|nr:hypothetical protein [Candidatus Lokiarchaeota archaeon]MBD3201145.1 hypothetical protein [Candidatus Lokiarchaeota archaeon]
MNRIIDYGVHLTSEEDKEPSHFFDDESTICKELIHFYQRDREQRFFIKACYLHHLLDFFKETHINLTDINQVFKRFLRDKVISQIKDKYGNVISFEKEIKEIFRLVSDNQDLLFKDLKGSYLTRLEKRTSIKNGENSNNNEI